MDAMESVGSIFAVSFHGNLPVIVGELVNKNPFFHEQHLANLRAQTPTPPPCMQILSTHAQYEEYF